MVKISVKSVHFYRRFSNFIFGAGNYFVFAAVMRDVSKNSVKQMDFIENIVYPNRFFSFI